MKIISKKCIFILVLITILFFDVNSVNAGQGCCSWHGGQAYCDRSTGRWVCNDGTYSPSCRCSTEELTDVTKVNNSNNKNNVMTYKETIEKQEQTNNDIDDNILPTIIIEILCFILFDKIKFKNITIKYKFIKKTFIFLSSIVVLTISWILIPFILGLYGHYILEIFSILLIKYGEHIMSCIEN